MPETSSGRGDPARDLVQAFLGVLGFQASPIPESALKTPDLSVELPNARLLIEVEAKKDDLQLRRLIESPPGTTRGYKRTALETLLRHAWRQIKDYPERTPADYSLVWLVSLNPGITTLARPTALAILYGPEVLSGTMSGTRERYEKTCYFFGHSFLFRRPDLDGVVLQDHRNLTLCLNPFSRRHGQFKETDFARKFETECTVVDPIAQEEVRDAFIADCEIPRNDRSGVVLYLQGKYHLETVTLNRFVLGNLPAD